MSEFATPFPSILSSGLRNIYSGRPTRVLYRACDPTMDQLRLKEQLHDMKLDVLRTSDFKNNSNSCLSKAPAYRVFSRSEMNETIERLRKPTVASLGLSNTSDFNTMARMQKDNPRYMGKQKVEQEEMRAILRRLNKSTKMSDIRRSQVCGELTNIGS